MRENLIRRALVKKQIQHVQYMPRLTFKPYGGHNILHECRVAVHPVGSQHYRAAIGT